MPYTGVVLTFVAIHAAAFLILLGHWVAAAGMFPKATRVFADVYDQRPIRATLVGLLTFGPLVVLFLLNAKIHNAPLRFLVFFALFGALLVALIGSAGLALRVGRNLSAGADTWQQASRGGVMLALVFITPLIGYLFVLPIGLASGFGVVFLARPWKAKTLPVPASASVSASAPEAAVPSLS